MGSAGTEWKLLPAASSLFRNCQRRGGLLGIATPQRRQQSPTSTTQRQERIASEPGGALFSSGGAKPPRSHHHQYPVAQYHDGGRFALVQMACCTSVQVMLESGDLPERQQSVRQDFTSDPRWTGSKDNPFPGKPAYILGIRNIQDLID